MVKLRDVKVAIAMENRLISHNSERRKRVGSAVCDDEVGAERLEESKTQGCRACKTLQRADQSSQHTVR